VKNILKVLICSLFIIAGTYVHAQTTVLPSATPTSATIPWSIPSNCTATNPCQFQVYRCNGSCIATSTAWTLIATTSAQATSYKDTTVAGGTLYTYDVEAVPNGSNSVFSGPSNTGSVTTLFTPLPPIIGIITTP
jgi:hypothetical protein